MGEGIGMTVVLLPNTAFISETSRMVAVYGELQRLGVPALVATHGGTYDWILNDAGVPFEHLDPILTEEDCRRTLEVICDPLRKPLFSRVELRKQVEGEMAFFRDVGARVALSGFTLSATLSARAAGIPLVVTHLGSWVPPVMDRGMMEVSEFFDSVFPFSLLPCPCFSLCGRHVLRLTSDLQWYSLYTTIYGGW